MHVDKRAMHSVHVITLALKYPDSFLPDEMKKHYGTCGIIFGDFPLQPIGRAKELIDEMPDSGELFNNGPPPGDVGTVVGEYYRRGDKDVGKLGHLKELLSPDAGRMT